MARRGKNEGTIFRRPNGSWRAQVSLGGRRFGHTSRSRAECQEWVRRTLGEIDQGMTFEERGLTLGEYLREWILVKRTAIRAKTAVQYEKLIQLYLEPGLGSIRLKDLNLRTVNLFYQKLIAQGVGVSNIRYSHRVLHAALEHAVRAGDLARNAAHGAIVPKKQHKEMQTPERTGSGSVPCGGQQLEVSEPLSPGDCDRNEAFRAPGAQVGGHGLATGHDLREAADPGHSRRGKRGRLHPRRTPGPGQSFWARRH